MSNSEIDHLEVEMDQAKEMISLNDELVKLLESPAGKKIIVEGYFEAESVRLVALLMDPEMQSEERQARIHRQMFGIGALQDYFTRVRRVAGMAADAMEDMQEAHTELLKIEV